MEPITILIYISSLVILVLWTYLTLVLHRVLRILNKIDRITDYIDHIRSLLETWERIPVKFITWLLKKFLK